MKNRTQARWWSYVKRIARDYPMLHRQLQEIHESNITANYGCVAVHGGECLSRSLENSALKELPRQEQREHDAVMKALRWTESKKNAEYRLRLIDIVFWKQSHTIRGAAMIVGYSENYAADLIREFLYRIAFYMGFADESELYIAGKKQYRKGGEK